jgi:hypothetical protein
MQHRGGHGASRLCPPYVSPRFNFQKANAAPPVFFCGPGQAVCFFRPPLKRGDGAPIRRNRNRARTVAGNVRAPFGAPPEQIGSGSFAAVLLTAPVRAFRRATGPHLSASSSRPVLVPAGGGRRRPGVRGHVRPLPAGAASDTTSRRLMKRPSKGRTLLGHHTLGIKSRGFGLFSASALSASSGEPGRRRRSPLRLQDVPQMSGARAA